MTALVLTGVSASRGIALGPARLLEGHDFEVAEYTLESAQLPGEIERYKQAVAAARASLQEIADNSNTNLAPEIKEFLTAHALMMDDDALSVGPLEYIRSRSINAEWALKLTRENLLHVFEAMEDEYFKARADDVNQVVGRIMAALVNRDSRMPDEASLADRIIVADVIEPNELTQMAERGAIGFVSETGGALSHSAILARSVGLPYIAGIKGARQMINEGAMLILDGERGIVLISPDEERLTRYREKQAKARERSADLVRLRGLNCQTQDLLKIKLWANAEHPADLRLARMNGAVGVGLYRTEFLFMRHAKEPSEEQQYEELRAAMAELEGLPLTVRTLDVGADKKLPLGQNPHEDNPALGLRGIRHSLRFPKIFKTQLRASLRASAHGPIRLLLPMIGRLQDIAEARSVLSAAQAELTEAGIAFDPQIPLGGMIEVPAAALMARQFARALDFLSIGTNDLTQYTLAVDRGNQELASLVDPLHPAILQLIASVIAAGAAEGKAVALCGEMAGEVRYTRLLLALGLRDFSMHPRVLLEVQEVIAECSARKLTALRDEVLDGEHENVLRFLAESS
jgi:phosphoenolpyruvate-protein phosphotransferase (PTS system enzyme I)